MGRKALTFLSLAFDNARGLHTVEIHSQRSFWEGAEELLEELQGSSGGVQRASARSQEV